MTLKTSLFNCGIYKANIRRYFWGSVFYAIVLLMLTVMVILFDVDPRNAMRYMPDHRSYLLGDVVLYGPLVISVAVPTVVALLVYRFVHSKKTSVFAHSLPVSRGTNYVSTVAAAFTLMAAPIILTGVVLVAMSVFGYGMFFDVKSCFVWMGINLLSLFLMFSVSSFSAFLTGNSFAMVGINALIHLISLILAGSISSLAYVFLYGYYETNALIQVATDWNFPVYIFSVANAIVNMPELPFGWFKIAIMIIIAIALYAAAFFLYKKRNMEKAEDVAAYKCLNPIYKYVLTLIVALGAFAVFSYTLEDGAWFAPMMVVIISAVVYFAAEMVLKKSFKIWSAYKGYLVFLAIFAICVSTFAFTSFFGYETYIPQLGKVEKVAVYDSRAYEDERYLSNPEIIEYAQQVHAQLVEKENMYTIEKYMKDRREGLYISYKLKNGKTVLRRYPVTTQMFCEVFDNLYGSHDYKRRNLDIFSSRIGEIYQININHNYETKINDPEKISQLIECIRADQLDLAYTQMRNHSSWYISVSVEYIPAEEMKIETDSRAIHSEYLQINANYTRTVEWLREHGYEKDLFNQGNEDLTVLTAEQWNIISGEKEKMIQEAASGGKPYAYSYETPKFENIPGAVRISDAAVKEKVRGFVLSTPVRYQPDKEYSHYICRITDGDYVDSIAAFYDDVNLSQFIG